MRDILPQFRAVARSRAQQARFQNGELCRLTEQVIFSDPYRAAKINRHTAPQLDAEAAALRADPQAKAAAAALKVTVWGFEGCQGFGLTSISICEPVCQRTVDCV